MRARRYAGRRARRGPCRAWPAWVFCPLFAARGSRCFVRASFRPGASSCAPSCRKPCSEARRWRFRAWCSTPGCCKRAARCGAEVREGSPGGGARSHRQLYPFRIQDSASIEAALVIGCDGVHSLVRRSLGVGTPGPERTAQAMRAIYEEVSLPRSGRADPGVGSRGASSLRGGSFRCRAGERMWASGCGPISSRREGKPCQSSSTGSLQTPSVRDALRGAKLRGRGARLSTSV